MKALSGRLKRCKWKGCAAMFKPERTMQQVCSPACGIRLANERESREWTRQAKERIKTRQDWLREAQSAFNAWIRERDHYLPCRSCGATHAGQWDASHYRSVGACPALRFEPDNVHKACSVCNQHHSGRIIEFRIALVKLLGQDRVEWLEQDHQPLKLAIEEIKEIKARYTKLARELKKQRGDL